MRSPALAHRSSSSLLLARSTVILSSLLHTIKALPATTLLNSLTLANGSYLFEPEEDEPDIDLGSEEFWTAFGTIMFLVIIGGIFAGLTLGLMGLDETNLHVLMQSGEEDERRNAEKVLALMNRGKHWVLVTLLLSNVIVNETLPIILDSVFGGGWQAVLISTALIVIFGEIIPQGTNELASTFVKAAATTRFNRVPRTTYISPAHYMALSCRFVLALMYFMYPVAYPTAQLLDYWLGESHGTVYRKAELKTLVSLHQANGPTDVEALTEDEVTIIGAVLDLRDKPISVVMTPMEDVFTLSTDHVLDERTVDVVCIGGLGR
ncbi:hypothetical protein BC938DRAFT_484297, partial [Jimgerdemannia flammicorona]